MNDITYRKLSSDEISDSYLDAYRRYQETRRCWFFTDGTSVLKECPHVWDWDADKRRNIAGLLRRYADKNAAFGAFCDGELAGFAALETVFSGSRGQYLNLPMLQVSADFRHRGIGKRLFAMITDEARSRGAEKLYISANNSEESQAFYRAVGCIDAKEVDKEQVEREPFDCQMEYVL